MFSTSRVLLTALALAGAAGASLQSAPPEIPALPPELPPVEGQPAAPVPLEPAPLETVPPALVVPRPSRPVPTRPPVVLDGVTATLFVPRTVTGALKLTFTVRSTRPAPVVFGVRRDNDQNCAFAPLLRVVEVGTQRVVYPVAGQQRLCTQEVVTKSTAVSGNVSFSRTLTLPGGEYMLESWLSARVGGAAVRVPARPVRVTVK
ncbi:hypothetical protein [uncultured Deinococcus sp.]|uniref:hypothetical protein n=1 Tax=uncultured Deinococcus sp. TaxID=158789 RepID=UPI0025EB1FE5|nr:hypothetical protein [uncultured Deinococcus sp.]